MSVFVVVEENYLMNSTMMSTIQHFQKIGLVALIGAKMQPMLALMMKHQPMMQRKDLTNTSAISKSLFILTNFRLIVFLFVYI